MTSSTGCSCTIISVFLTTSLTLFLCNILAAQAMFFTDSKDNDYPRIGKRPLPSQVYKQWLSDNDRTLHEHVPYEVRLKEYKDFLRAMRNNALLPVTREYQRSEVGDVSLLSRGSNFDDTGIEDKVWGYLQTDTDLDF